MRRIIAVIAAAAIVASLWLPRADATEPREAAGTSLSDAEIERRLDFIEQRLDASERHAQIWHWSWLTVNGGATVAPSVAAAVANDGEDWATYIPQAALAALGVADLTVIRPLRALWRRADPRPAGGHARAAPGEIGPGGSSAARQRRAGRGPQVLAAASR